MCCVNRHWRAALLAAAPLWASTQVELCGDRPEEKAGQLAFVVSRAHAIRELDLSLHHEEDWPDAAFMLGRLGPGLRRLSLETTDCCELPAGAGAFLAALPGLTALELSNCCAELPAGIGRLTSLRELLVSREAGPAPGEELCVAPLERLTQLTQLELVR
jgi:hypothetical protein